MKVFKYSAPTRHTPREGGGQEYLDVCTLFKLQTRQPTSSKENTAVPRGNPILAYTGIILHGTWFYERPY